MEAEPEHIVESWIKMCRGLQVFRGEPDSELLDENLWASEYLSLLVEDEPERAWDIILSIRNATSDYKILAVLAAGHFEDLVNAHGNDFIARMEQLAKEDNDFRHFVGGIWPSDEMPAALRSRIKAIALKPHWDTSPDE